MRLKIITLTTLILVLSGCGEGTLGQGKKPPSGGPKEQHPRVDLNDTGVNFFINYQNFDQDKNAHPTVYDAYVSGLPVGQDAASGLDTDPAKTNVDGKDGFAFKKIAALDGTALPPDAIEFGCVKDEVTGLIWENKALKGLHNSNDLFTWYSTDTTTNGGDAGENYDATQCAKTAKSNTGDGKFITGDTQQFIEQVKTERLCGRTDWRLPTVEEMRSITDYSADQDTPMVDPIFFPHLHRTTHRWTSQTDVNSPKSAWAYHVADGFAHSHNKACKLGQGFSNGIILVSGTLTY